MALEYNSIQTIHDSLTWLVIAMSEENLHKFIFTVGMVIAVDSSNIKPPLARQGMTSWNHALVWDKEIKAWFDYEEINPIIYQTNLWPNVKGVKESYVAIGFHSDIDAMKFRLTWL